MNIKKQKLLERKAAEANCKTVDEFILQSELQQVIKRVNDSFDRAVVLSDPPELWDVYVDSKAKD